MQNRRLKWMALQIAQHDAFGAITQIQGQHMGIDSLVLQLVEDIQVIQDQRLWILPAAVQNCPPPYKMAGTLPARRRRRLAPFPKSPRGSALSSNVTLIEIHSIRLKQKRDAPATKRAVLSGSTVRLDRIAQGSQKQGTDRFFEMDAAHGFGQQAGHADLADVRTSYRLGTQRDGIGNDQFVQRRPADVLGRRTG